MFAKSVAEFLELNGYGEIDKSIFINRFPSRDDCDDAICVYDNASYAIRGRARNSVSFRCQIRVRNAQGILAEKKAFEIYSVLELKGKIEDFTGKKFTICPLNPPQFLMYDDANRGNWTLNITALATNY